MKDASTKALFTALKNRLLLLGIKPFEAPYAAREGMAFAKSLGFQKEAEIVRVVVAYHTFSRANPPNEQIQEILQFLLHSVDFATEARLEVLERRCGTSRPDDAPAAESE